MTVFTIGHSNRTLEDFLDILHACKIKKIIDVRTIPRSSYNPQFNKETLRGSLSKAGIDYTHMPGLGGLRRPKRDSPNKGWRNASFRGFADYTLTQEFKDNIKELIDAARRGPVAVMCAEALPWRCHRSLIADALKVRGINVEHIMGKNSCKSHAITPWAKLRGLAISYA